jgi:hypothetical protein
MAVLPAFFSASCRPARVAPGGTLAALSLEAMRYEDEEDPKKPHPVWGGRKGDNAAEDREHGPDQVGPDGKEHDSHYHHMHVRC